MTPKLINTEQLLKASKASVRKFGEIRGLSLNKTLTLDPDGIHVIDMALGGEQSVRCHVLCKIMGRDDPVEAWTDMEYATYNDLKNYDDVRKLVAE